MTGSSKSKSTSITTPSVNPNWAKLPLFNRKGWKTVRFGDVVENVNDTERMPAEAGIERFIGLEHLEPGLLHIREWGNVADGTTFTRRCRPKQVLFGKRRAYQRKVAVAEFDAVVSGDIYVLAPKGDRLLPELLPFLCLSERFFHHAVGTSAGSLSPRTNWSSLASFEFALPPLDQQRRIAEILWAVDASAEAHISLKQSHQNYVSSLSHAVLTCGVDVEGQPRKRSEGEQMQTPIGPLPRYWSAVPLAEFAVEKGVVNGPFGSDLLTSELQAEGVPVIYVRDVKPGRYARVSTVCVTPEKAQELAFCDVQRGDVLVAKVGEPPCDAAPYVLSEPSIVTQDVIRIRPRSDTDGHFIAGLLNSSFGRNAVSRITIGGGRMRVSLTEFKTLVLPKPPLDEQARIGATLEAADEFQRKSELYLGRMRKLQQKFIESLVGGSMS
jgi:type I restriction enzyme S subunit